MNQFDHVRSLTRFTIGDSVYHNAHGLGVVRNTYENGEVEVYFSRDEFKWVYANQEITHASPMHVLLFSSFTSEFIASL